MSEANTRDESLSSQHHSKTPSLEALSGSDAFIARHIGPRDNDVADMLSIIGEPSLDTLIDRTVPDSIRQREALPLPGPVSEEQALARIAKLAQQNTVARSYIGMGYYSTFVPRVIQRNILENPGWYTAYTPYQPEISQGRLEALLNFQTMVMDLTGMEVANASLLDEATAAAEAMALCKRLNKKNKSNVFFIDEQCFPQTIAVLKTRAEFYGFEVYVGSVANDLAQTDVFAAIIQYPAANGQIDALDDTIAALHEKQAMAVIAADIMSLVLLKSPGEMGADVVIGNTQRFGVPMGAGGPHAAYIATRDAHKRALPGRLIGVSIDRHQQPALRMAMQTREQHIRREKATSNICTAQALLAIMASSYAVYHGPDGLRRIAQRIHRLTQILSASLKSAGIKVDNSTFFDTLTISSGSQTAAARQHAESLTINLRAIDSNTVGISLDETTTLDDVADLLSCFSENHQRPSLTDLSAMDDSVQAGNNGIPAQLQRQSTFLSHPVFNSHHSETQMLRYIKQLEDKDIALNRSMIALGSCTMKLNATSEMIPVTWPEFGNIHPFAPKQQLHGYQQLTQQLEEMLAVCTGYDAVSLQPNAGSQGEYAGLIAIQRYHQSRGDHQRQVCLIPSSAHGTNPASAVMVGMQVVIVDCDSNGNVDINDLRSKAEQHQDKLAAIMVTYPSTHGVFEEAIGEICDIVHSFGGQVYVDGANLNALVGLASPGGFGADVSHINLHKTFCIPHGGGGPGMGPIGVKSHLSPFLPEDPLDKDARQVVSAANWGSASILPISWVYMTMMGGSGLTKATEIAILNANYVAARLRSHYPVLYTGANGLVAHECIIDMRPLKELSGITEEDVAKRLIDYGFHAPTMSFPVAGTLMIEPTESEDKAELDRFCDALISIRQEIDKVQRGDWPADDNPLRNAPHTLADVCAENWAHPYSRETAGYPLPWLRNAKYWPPVNRIDNVYGDRNLICACPSIDNYR